MSAPMKLTSAQLRDLSNALDALTKVTTDFGVVLCPYGPLQLQLGETVVAAGWDGEAYVIDDRNGD